MSGGEKLQDLLPKFSNFDAQRQRVLEVGYLFFLCMDHEHWLM